MNYTTNYRNLYCRTDYQNLYWNMYATHSIIEFNEIYHLLYRKWLPNESVKQF
jgi:hypothetical protein